MDNTTISMHPDFLIKILCADEAYFNSYKKFAINTTFIIAVARIYIQQINEIMKPVGLLMIE